jgi:hypothetical protein
MGFQEFPPFDANAHSLGNAQPPLSLTLERPGVSLISSAGGEFDLCHFSFRW